MFKSAPYSLFWLPRFASTGKLTGDDAPATFESGCAAAARLSSNSSNRFTGKRADGVLIVLLRMKSSSSKPEKKCGFPAASKLMAFVMPLGAKIQVGNFGKKPLAPVAQPGPSPDIG